MGGMITGEPSVLKEHFDRMIAEYKAQRFQAAYDSAKAGIKVYEESKKAEGGVAMTTGGVTPEGVAILYSVGAELAQRLSDHASALMWAESAVVTIPTPERKALLVTALLNSKKQKEAEKLVEETLAQKDEASEKFKTLLQEIGVLKK